MTCLPRPLLPLLLASACSFDLHGSIDGEDETTTAPATTKPDETPTTGDDTTEDGTTGAGTSSGETTTTTSETSETTGAPTTGEPDALAGSELLTRLGGLWTGPATMTVLGDFPLMNLDMRAATPHLLFGRVDLDPFNSLRFALSIETHEGVDVVVFRNGGQFMGLDRDTRTRLVESDAAAGHYRFCAITKGCEYIDAVFSVDDDHLTLDVAVKGAPHLLWDAARAEPRGLPEPFPADLASQGPGDAPFPPMPALAVTVTWAEPLPAPADVWAIVTTTPCDLLLQCTHSRSLRTLAPAGATSATLTMLQVHPGAYQVNAILDRDQNVPQTLGPDSGDGVGVPNKPALVADTGETAVSTAIVFDFP